MFNNTIMISRPSSSSFTLAKRLGILRAKIRRGSKSLAESLNVPIVRSNSNNWYCNKEVVINWGCSYIPVLEGHLILNHPHAVSKAINKIDTFRCIQSAPKFATDFEEACNFFKDYSHIFCRTTVSGRKGKGIVIADCSDDMVEAPLYTPGYNVICEFRVHSMGEKVIGIQQKKKLSEESLRERSVMPIDRRIRNKSNGWIFSTKIDKKYLSKLEELAFIGTSAINSLELHFGAVDVILTDEGIFVLEVNTAPGLDEVMLDKYTSAFTDYLISIRG
ncbi:putative ATP grasp protein [Caudoviricetes sp.]|nr:putative ATP grasp protein [Caudoviricetes sp.]